MYTNHSYALINKGHARNAGGYRGRNVVFRLLPKKDDYISPKNYNQNSLSVTIFKLLAHS